ncbi:hypothetical protein ONZ51_g8661 [Trametes cubensis]|uniref:Uncharacterized protein n=1 Tax=Trametes cubensis TaxID=1111947 RepID=A0AAD7TQC8_9APHY|nr:hypothetical protein ONZ51_g8661 [Trametes cubensis]
MGSLQPGVVDVEKPPSTGDDTSSNGFVYVVDRAAERRLVRRIDMHIVPAAMMIHLLCFIDRSNIGNAKVLNRDEGDSLEQTLHITNQQYLIALMVFIVAFTIVQTPSNYMLKRFRPSRWMALMMFCWGVIPCSVEQGSNPSCLNTKTMDYVIALSLTLNLVHTLDIVTANSFQESLEQDVISCQRQI